MGSGIGLRGDFDGVGLRALAKATKDAGQARRLVALAAIYDGGARGEAARTGGVGLQTVRDRLPRFNARRVPAKIEQPTESTMLWPTIGRPQHASLRYSGG